MQLPVIDMSPLFGRDARPRSAVAETISRACRDTGFFYVTGHEIPSGLIARMDSAARRFFALSDNEKQEIAMSRGGRAWRGVLSRWRRAHVRQAGP